MGSRPNFFIVGAPKSGTTALYFYLNEHPAICMSKAKEPHYFAKDFINYPSYRSEKQYLKLFNHCNESHLAIGEASVWYLYSEVALKLVSKYDKHARIIVMLRNPVDLAYSMHMQAVYNFNENEPNFEKAWALQAEREIGNNIPSGCRAEQILQYKKLASLGYQLKKAYSIFPEDQVHVIFFEDFIENTKEIYEEVLLFLGVPTDQRSEFPKVNESKVQRSRTLGWLTQTPPSFMLSFVRYLREHMKIDIMPVVEWIRRLNAKPDKRKPLSESFRQQLKNEFKEDVLLLEELTGRDLGHWMQ